MAIVLKSVAPSRELYEQVNAKLGSALEAAPGLIVHTASEVGGEVHIVDVWESEDAAMAFGRDHLAAAIESVGGVMEMPEITEVFHIQRP
jgi:hypothetical protein